MSLRVEEQERRRPDCPYCKGAVEDGSATWSCPRCATVLHADCARSNGGCTVLGCGGAVAPSAQPPRPAGVARQRHESGEVVAVIFVVSLCLGGAFWMFGGFFTTQRPEESRSERSERQTQGRDGSYEGGLDEIDALVREVVRLDREKLSSSASFNRALERYQEVIQVRYEARTQLSDRLTRGWESDTDGRRRVLLVLEALASGRKR